MQIDLNTFEIERMVAHEVRNASRALKGAECVESTKLIVLDSDGHAALNQRFAQAIGAGSKSMELVVADSKEESLFRKVASFPVATEDEFIAASRLMARSLTKCQTAPSIKDGVFIVISGSVRKQSSDGQEEKVPFAMLMKADPDSGFVNEIVTGGMSISYLKAILFTAKQRLYKIACFVRAAEREGVDDGSNYFILYYDHLVTAEGGQEAAQYFYGSFLGCELKHTAKQETKQFFEAAKDAIAALPTTPERKVEYRAALTTYMRTPGSTCSVQQFANEYLHQDCADVFSRNMKKAGVPTRTIQKDVSGIASRLKVRAIRFSSGVKISGSHEVMEKSFKIISSDPESVTVRIEGAINDQP